jgi:hypothetical protein
MPGLTLTEAAGVLKEFYTGVIREQLNNKTVLSAQLKRGADNIDVASQEAVFPIHVQRNSGIGMVADGGSLRSPGNQKSTKARVPLRTHTGRVRFTMQTLKAMRSDKGAFERAATSETKRIVNDLRSDRNRQLFGTSDGVIASTGVTTSSTTVVLAAATTAVELRHLSVGMRIDIGAVASPTAVASDREITAVNVAAKTITISGAAVTTATTDRVFRAGNGGATGGVGQVELTGLRTIVSDTGTLHSVNPTTFPVWKATVSANGGTNRSITENLLEAQMDAVSIDSDSEIDIVVTSHGVMRAYSTLLTTLKRFPGTNDLKGGFKGLDITAGGKTATMVKDKDSPLNTAFGLSLDALEINEWCDWEWMEDPDMFRQTPDKLELEATIYKIEDLGTGQRNAHFKLADLTES